PLQFTALGGATESRGVHVVEFEISIDGGRQLPGKDQATLHDGQEDCRLAGQRRTDLLPHARDRRGETGLSVDQLGAWQCIGKSGSAHLLLGSGQNSAWREIASSRLGLSSRASQVGAAAPRRLSPRAAGQAGRWAVAVTDCSTIAGLQARINSQPARRCASMRAGIPPMASAAAMPMSSPMTMPLKPISLRRMSPIQMLEKSAAIASIAG